MVVTPENIGKMVVDPSVVGILVDSPRQYGRTEFLSQLVREYIDRGEIIFIPCNHDHLDSFKLQYYTATNGYRVEPVYKTIELEPLRNEKFQIIGMIGGNTVFTGFKISK